MMDMQETVHSGGLDLWCHVYFSLDVPNGKKVRPVLSKNCKPNHTRHTWRVMVKGHMYLCFVLDECD